MEQQSSQTVGIFRARENLLNQLERQGYNVTDYEGSNLNEVNSMFESKQMDMLVENTEDNKKHMLNTI